MQIARLGAMALVDEHEDVALGAEALGQRLLHLGHEASDIASALVAVLAGEFVNQRAQQPLVGRVELGDEVRA